MLSTGEKDRAETLEEMLDAGMLPRKYY